MQPMKLGYWVAWAALCAGLLAPNAGADDKMPPLQGIYDGYSYVSPLGLFSVFVRDTLDLNSFKDDLKDLGKEVALSYRDKLGNTFSILAAKPASNLSPVFLEDIVESLKNKPGTLAEISKTPDLRDCALVRELIQERPDKHLARLTCSFYAHSTIFTVKLGLQTPAKTAAEAEKGITELLKSVWQDVYFRGRLDDQITLSPGEDPRFAAVISSAKRAADLAEYRFSVELGKRPVLHIYNRGKGEDSITLNIRLRTVGNLIETSEAVACAATQKQQGLKMQEKFFKILDRFLVEEKARIKRSAVFDQDLLIGPNAN